ncbi:MAG: hypothetical protein ABI588_00135 [Arenimonas sp.]
MRELLPPFLAAAFGNHLLLRYAKPYARAAAPSAWWPVVFAGLCLLAIASETAWPRLDAPAALYLRMLALAAIAWTIAREDSSVDRSEAWWRRHAHALAALVGANLAMLAYGIATAAPPRLLAGSAFAASVLLALLLLALPALRERLALAQRSAGWRDGLPTLLLLMGLALAMSGLAGVLP